MTTILEFIKTHYWLFNALASLTWIICVLILRQFLVQRLRHSGIQSADLRRQWIVQIRNGCFLLVLLGLVVIWATEIRTIALSLLAILVALVLATKELILCLTGSFFKASSGGFAIGDRIEVNNIRGDVIDQTLLSTKIMEIGPGQQVHLYTGRSIVLPNSLFLTAPVINESLIPRYVLHSFTIPLKAEDDWQQAERDLLVAANEICAPHIDDARKHISKFIANEGLDISSVDLRITLSIPEPGRLNLIVRVPVPVDHIGRINQEILRRYLTIRAEEKET